MYRFSKKVTALLLCIVLMLSMVCTAGFAADTIKVKVRIQGCKDGTTGEILDEYTVTLNDDSGFTAMDALEKACTLKGISYTTNSGYTSEIDGQTDTDFPASYYGGWMYRVWQKSDQPSSPREDLLPSVGAGNYDLHNGDKVTWYYALPAHTYYTIISNYGSISSKYDEGSSFNVYVRGQKFTDTMTWSLTGFLYNASAKVVVERISDGKILKTATANSSGKAVVTLPAVSSDTKCYVYVDNTYYTLGDKATAMKRVKSWRKTITIEDAD